VRHRAALIDIIQQVMLTRGYEDWERVLLAAGIPVGAINDIGQVIDHPQVKARGAIVEVDHPRAGRVGMAGVPVKLGATPGSIRTPSPALGEHTAQTLETLLGMGAEEIGALKRAGVVMGAG
jgi:formyl-CoA transferase/CoA:oxalate CoA-transferase